jgi:hypothetical protein
LTPIVVYSATRSHGFEPLRASTIMSSGLPGSPLKYDADALPVVVQASGRLAMPALPGAGTGAAFVCSVAVSMVGASVPPHAASARIASANA